MKRPFYILLFTGVILVLLAVLFKEFGWRGGRELKIAGICVVLIAMVLYLYSLVRNKPINTD